MITEADCANRQADDLRPCVQHVLKLFGQDLLMFGSDGPVCRLAGSWKAVLAAFTQACGPLPETERKRTPGVTAVSFHKLS
jgi:L-fuconolactonase